jgi:hypothetical protein
MNVSLAATSSNSAQQLLVKERPILFSGPMVRAILEGRKTQTRRVIKDPIPEWVTEFGHTFFCLPGEISGRGLHPEHGPAEILFRCRYGKKGERLWVRESWHRVPNHPDMREGDPRVIVGYAAGGERMVRCSTAAPQVSRHLRPSIHMPRWASRINLEITGFRIERLQQITEADAAREGFIESEDHTPRGAFRQLWDSINGGNLRHGGSPWAWTQNPWVWVLEFRRLDG